MNSFNLPMNVNKRHVSCSQGLYHYTLFHLHRHTCMTINVYEFRSLSAEVLIWRHSEGKTKKLNTVQFVPLHAFFLSRTIKRHYFSAPLHITCLSEGYFWRPKVLCSFAKNILVEACICKVQENKYMCGRLGVLVINIIVLVMLQHCYVIDIVWRLLHLGKNARCWNNVVWSYLWIYKSVEKFCGGGGGVFYRAVCIQII
jgi:hypothetical protein